MLRLGRASVRLVYNTPTPTATAHLLCGPNSQSLAITAEHGGARARVDAQVEVQVGAVLVRARHAALSAQRITTRRAEVRYLDDDAVACVGDGVSAAVGLDGEFPAGAASWASAGTLSNALIFGQLL